MAYVHAVSPLIYPSTRIQVYVQYFCTYVRTNSVCIYNKVTTYVCSLTGYINNSGDLHMERFETYLQALAEVQYVHVQSMQAFVPTYVLPTVHS